MSAVRLSAAAIICVSATVVAAGWSPGHWIGDSRLARVLTGRDAMPRFGLGASPPAPAIVTATKTSYLLNDADSDGLADPGDTIRYMVDIAADAGGGDAADVHVSDVLDPNTTLVDGSIAITPVMANDSYVSVGNMTLTSASIAADCATSPLRSVTCNDVLYGATLIGFGAQQASANGTPANGVNTVTTANTGTVVLAVDGTFVYEPLAGYEGPDSFWYTVSGDAGTAVAQATVTVGSDNAVTIANKMVWFVSVAGGGTGTQAQPMTLAALGAINSGSGSNPNNGDSLYLFEGTHTAGFSLRANQKLIGQDATVAVPVLGGPAPHPGNAYPAVNPTSTRVNTNSVSLNAGNTIAGFTAGNSSTAMSGSSSGTLSVRDVVLNGNSRGLTLTNATGVSDGTFTGFTSISSAAGTTGIQLSAINGTLNLGGGLLSGNTGVSFVIVGGNATINYSGTIQNSGSRQISISNKTGGAVNFTGLVGGTGTGIFLDNNDLGSPGLATLTFSGGISTVALTATNGGIINVCDRNPCAGGSAVVNTLSSPTATVLNVTGTTIGASGLRFQSLTSGNSGSSIATGITLSATGTAGGLTVTGTGTPGSGGTIRNKTGADSTPTQGTGISLTNTAGVSLAWMQLNGFANHAIRGTNVTGLTLSQMVINGTNGTTTTGQREGAVHIDGLFTTGSFPAAQTASISNSIVGGTGAGDLSLTDNVRIVNTSGTLDRLTVANSTFGNLGAVGVDSIGIDAQGTAVMKVTVSDSIFTSARNALLRVYDLGSATVDLVARRNTMSNDNADAANASGILIGGDTAGTASSVTYDVSCNTIRGSGSAALALLKGNGNGAWSGSIVNNTIGVSGVVLSGSRTSGIKISSNGTGSHTVMIAENAVYQTNERGIWLTAGDSQAASNGAGPGVMNATLFGNMVREFEDQSDAGLSIDAGTAGTDDHVVNVVVGGSIASHRNDFAGGDTSASGDVSTTGTATAVINLSKNGSASVTADGVLADDNLNPAFTTRSIGGTVNVVESLPSTPPAVAACTQVARFETPGLMRTAVLARRIDSSRIPAPASRVRAPGPSDVRAVVLTTLARSATAFQTGTHAAWTRVRNLAAMAGDALVAGVEASSPQPGPAIDLDLGTVPAGRTVTVLFSVTVNEPAVSYTNEATISGTNFGDVLTDATTTYGDVYNTTALLTSSLNPASSDAPVTFTATVTASGPPAVPVGTVQFKDGADTLGSPIECTASGADTCTAVLTTTLAVGSHDVRAEYSSGTSFHPSTTNVVVQIVYACTDNPVVTIGEDSGAGSLRQAILDACVGATITFDGVETIGLTSGQLTIDRDVTLSGPGAALLTVERVSGEFRIFAVAPGVTATIEGLTIANGLLTATLTGGAGIYNDTGTLTVRNTTLTGNVTAYVAGAILSEAKGTGTATLTVTGSTLTANSAGAGGAIVSLSASGATSIAAIAHSTFSGNSGVQSGGALVAVGNPGSVNTLSVTDSTFSGNSAGNAGALYVSGQGGTVATLSITNTTVSGNTADVHAGGIAIGGALATITNSTITGNRADNTNTATGLSGGLYVLSGDVTLNNTIVAGNFVGGTPATTADDVVGALAAASASNLIGVDTAMTGVTHGTNGNQVGTAASPIVPRLGVLAANGGSTSTHALLPGSPALDAGDNTFAIGGTDQRGFARIRDAADAGTVRTVDIGSFEADPSVEDVADRTTNEDTPLTFVFGVGDDTAAILFDSITATSSDTTLLPNANAVVSADTPGTRTLTVTPAANRSGTTTITVTATKTVEGTPVSMLDTFVLTVESDNDPPTLAAIANQMTVRDAIANVSLTVGDVETPATELLVTAVSSDQAVVPDAGLIVSSGGASRTLTITPAAGATGTATITVTVSDGCLSASRSFLLTVHLAIHTGDFNGDGIADIAVYRPSTGQWFIRGQAVVQWGNPGDVPVSGDYNGDGLEDAAVFRPSTNIWFVKNQFNVAWGQRGDVPVRGDFDGNGTTDVAVYRPSTGDWLVRDQFTVTFGGPGYVPVVGDYNDDGTDDLAIFQPSTGVWEVQGQLPFVFGNPGDRPVPGDYDGDGTTDIAVYRPAAGEWLVRNQFTVQFGDPGDLPVPRDYDGNGTIDVAVYRPSTGHWFVKDQLAAQFGDVRDIPVPVTAGIPLAIAGDYDGDGAAEIALHRPTTNQWFVRNQPTVTFGLASDVPVPADYDGDRRMDVAVYRPSTGDWLVRNQPTMHFGDTGDEPVPQDYNGDGLMDVAVYRPSTGQWFVRGRFAVQFGDANDIAVPGDYDADGVADIAVYRPSTGQWFVRNQMALTFGNAGDIPVPADYNGDGRMDIAVYRPSTGTWYVRNQFAVSFGDAGDAAVPADYNGDGLTDMAVYRPSTGMWYVRSVLSVGYGGATYAPMVRIGAR